MSLDPMPIVTTAQKEAIRSLAGCSAALAQTEAALRAAEQSTGMELCPSAPLRPATSTPAVNSLFLAALGARHAERRASGLLTSALKKLEAELKERQTVAEQCRSEIEKSSADLAQALEAARAHKQLVSEAVSKERASFEDKGDTVYQGCALGLGLGCLALAGYIVLTVAMIFTGRQSGASNPLGVVFLALFVLPVGVSALLQIGFGLKRMMVESELSAKIRAADGFCDRAVENAKKAHGSAQPELESRLREAEEAAERIDAAIKALKPEEGGPQSPATDPAPE